MMVLRRKRRKREAVLTILLIFPPSTIFFSNTYRAVDLGKIIIWMTCQLSLQTMLSQILSHNLFPRLILINLCLQIVGFLSICLSKFLSTEVGLLGSPLWVLKFQKNMGFQLSIHVSCWNKVFNSLSLLLKKIPKKGERRILKNPKSQLQKRLRLNSLVRNFWSSRFLHFNKHLFSIILRLLNSD